MENPLFNGIPFSSLHFSYHHNQLVWYSLFILRVLAYSKPCGPCALVHLNAIKCLNGNLTDSMRGSLHVLTWLNSTSIPLELTRQDLSLRKDPFHCCFWESNRFETLGHIYRSASLGLGTSEPNPIFFPHKSRKHVWKSEDFLSNWTQNGRT